MELKAPPEQEDPLVTASPKTIIPEVKPTWEVHLRDRAPRSLRRESSTRVEKLVIDNMSKASSLEKEASPCAMSSFNVTTRIYQPLK